MNRNSHVNPTPYPKNTAELLFYIAKGLPQQLLKALPISIAVGVGIWLLHTYLLVFKNEGFHPGSWLGENILNTTGHLISSTLLWAMAGAVIPLIVSYIKKGGSPIEWIFSILKMPYQIFTTNKATGGKFLPALCFSIAATLFLFFDGALSGITSLIVGAMVMSSVLAFLARRGAILIEVIRMALRDIQMLIIKRQRFTLDKDSVLMTIGASGITLVVIGLSKTLPTPSFLLLVLDYAWIGMAILGAVLYFNTKKAPQQFMFLLVPIGAAVLFPDLTALADDGGWRESGGTFQGWIGSEGALIAMLLGLPPAIASLIGAALASIIANLPPLPAEMQDGSLPEEIEANLPALPVEMQDGSLPEEIEYTYPDGRHTLLRYDANEGGYINLLSDGIIYCNESNASDEINNWNKKNWENHLNNENWRAHNQELERTGQDVQSQAMNDITAKHLEEMRALAIEKRIRLIKHKIQEPIYEEAAMWLQHDRDIGKRFEGRAEWMLEGADFGVDILGTLTGPATKPIKWAYTILKNLGKNISKANCEGTPLAEGVALGAVEAVEDIAFSEGVGKLRFNRMAGTTKLPAVVNAIVSRFEKKLIRNPVKQFINSGDALKYLDRLAYQMTHSVNDQKFRYNLLGKPVSKP